MSLQMLRENSTIIWHGTGENIDRELCKWTVEADLIKQVEVRVIISKLNKSCQARNRLELEREAYPMLQVLEECKNKEGQSVITVTLVVFKL